MYLISNANYKQAHMCDAKDCQGPGIIILLIKK